MQNSELKKWDKNSLRIKKLQWTEGMKVPIESRESREYTKYKEYKQRKELKNA
jgi:hypothetical protein